MQYAIRNSPFDPRIANCESRTAVLTSSFASRIFVRFVLKSSGVGSR